MFPILVLHVRDSRPFCRLKLPSAFACYTPACTESVVWFDPFDVPRMNFEVPQRGLTGMPVPHKSLLIFLTWLPLWAASKPNLSGAWQMNLQKSDSHSARLAALT